MKPSADYIAGVEAMRDRMLETLREKRSEPDMTEERRLLLIGLEGAAMAIATDLKIPLRFPTERPDAEQP